MERKKVRVGDKTIKMHDGRGLLGRYVIAKHSRSHQETKFTVFNFFKVNNLSIIKMRTVLIKEHGVVLM